MTAPEHVSLFELDTWFASTPAERESPAGREIADHVGSCASCKRHLETLEADTALPRAPAPSLAPARRRRLTRLLPAAGAVLALAAGTLLYVRERSAVEEASYVGVKGTPAAQVLVRRAGGVQLWDGRAPVHSGDALAVRVACEDFAHVAIVADAPDDRAIVRAWDGACPAPPSDAPLPFTFVVDDQPGRERFAVVFSRAPLDDGELGATMRGAVRDRNAWTLTFDFAKED